MSVLTHRERREGEGGEKGGGKEAGREEARKGEIKNVRKEREGGGKKMGEEGRKGRTKGGRKKEREPLVSGRQTFWRKETVLASSMST